MSNGKYMEMSLEARHGLVRKVGEALGVSWCYRNPTLNGDESLAHWAELIHKDGYSLSFTSQYPTYALHVSGGFPRDTYFPSGEARPAINVSPEKSAEQIAKDITRRLLPGYLLRWEKAIAAQRERDAYAADQKALTAEIFALFPSGGACVPDWTKDQSTIHVNIAGVYGEIQTSRDSCSIKLRSVPCALAKDIVRLIVGKECQE